MTLKLRTKEIYRCAIFLRLFKFHWWLIFHTEESGWRYPFLVLPYLYKYQLACTHCVASRNFGCVVLCSRPAPVNWGFPHREALGQGSEGEKSEIKNLTSRWQWRWLVLDTKYKINGKSYDWETNSGITEINIFRGKRTSLKQRPHKTLNEYTHCANSPRSVRTVNMR